MSRKLKSRDCGSIRVDASARHVENQLARDAQLLAHVRDSVIVTDLEGIVTYWNEGATQLYGWRADEMLGRPVYARTPEPDRARTIAAFNAIRDGQDFSGEWEDVRKDGTRIWIDTRVTRVMDADGRPVGLMGVAHDITPRKRIEQQLRRSEAQLNEAQQLAHIGSWNWDIVSNSVVWSDELYRIFGLEIPGGEMTYDRFLSLVHPDDQSLMQDSVDRCVRGPEPFFCSYRVIQPDGVVRWVRSEGKVNRDEHGTAIRMFGTAQDVTERRRAEDALHDYAERLQTLSRRVIEVQEEERGHLARELHDEIGQVLSAVSVNLQAVKGIAPAESWARLDESIQVVDHALQQVRTLSLDLRPAILDDLGLVPTLRWYADRLAQRAGFALHFHVESSGQRLPPDMRIGCYRVAQEALTNIVRHAQAKEVHIDFYRSDETVEMSIRDDGIGFDPQAARGRARRGTSFGLLGMQERIELLGGTLELVSEPRRGATVKITLPLVQGEADAD